jgi:hydrogenase maturation protease
VRRIICVGNRFVPADSAGPRVFDRLAICAAIPGVEVVDGGTAGLNLLSVVEGCELVVFVDAVQGFAAPGEVMALSSRELAAAPRMTPLHGADLVDVIVVAPRVLGGRAPEMVVLGIETPADELAIEAAAERSVALALGGAARGGGQVPCPRGGST